MSKYEEYLRIFHEDYEEPTVDGYIVGNSGLTPKPKVKPEKINHDELGGLKGGDFDGYYHLTGEELDQFSGYQEQIDTLEDNTEASVRELTQNIASVQQEASTAVSNLRNDTEQGISEAKQEASSAVTALKNETNQAIATAKQEASSAVNTLRDDTEEDIASVRQETSTAVSNLKDETTQKIGQISSELDTTQSELSGRISGVVGSQAKIKSNQEQINARIDEIVGGVTEDTEILDARVDEDGNTHPNLGANIRNIQVLVKESERAARERERVLYEHIREQNDNLAEAILREALDSEAPQETLKDRISHWEQKSLEAQEHISEQLAELSLGVIRNAKSVQETAEENQQRALAHKKYADREIANLRENVDTNAYTLIKMAGMLSRTTTGGSEYINPLDWSKSESLAIPEPRCAVVNFTGINAMPTSKTAELDAFIEFWDMAGNYFMKPIKCAAQGQSSMNYPKKNVKFDLLNEDGSEFELKIGDWVSQDGFHLKAYYTDYFRGIAVTSYKFYDDIVRFNGTEKDRPYKKGLGVTEGVTPTGSVIQDIELQLETGALCHPDGFPCLVYLNGEFYGIFSWQIKKHRKNYHMEKSNVKHIHIDGDNPTLLRGNGIYWPDFEVRNPNKLYTMDGAKYDGDAPKELIDSTSENYDTNNKDHVRTAKVKQSIQSFSTRFKAFTALYNQYVENMTDERKAELREMYASIFDWENVRDYVIFNDIILNADGLHKNTQLITYDGEKWFLSPYDLDNTLGLFVWGENTILPPMTEHAGYQSGLFSSGLVNLFGAELEQRYAELREAGIIDTEHILSILKDWCARIGTANFELEYEKWPDSPCIVKYTDSIYRVRKWLETEIANMDTIYHYVPKEQQQQQKLSRIDERLTAIDKSIEELLEGGVLEYEGAAVARNSETNDMLDDVFNGDGSGGEALSEIPEALKDKVTTPEEFDDMLSEIFG